MSGISFSYQFDRGYSLYLPDYTVKPGSSFRGKHEFFISHHDWEYEVRIIITYPHHRMIDNIAEVFIPLQTGTVHVPVGHLGSVLKTLQAVAVL